MNKAIFAEFVNGFFAPVGEHLADPSVSEVLINGPYEVHVERKGRLTKSAAQFASVTGSGKSLIPADERIITIEDARELHLSQDHVVALESRPADPEDKGCVTIGDLFGATMRMGPIGSSSVSCAQAKRST